MPDDAICESVIRSRVVAADTTALRAFLFSFSAPAFKNEIIDYVRIRAMPRLLFKIDLSINQKVFK
jgi:ribosome-binding factor A